MHFASSFSWSVFRLGLRILMGKLHSFCIAFHGAAYFQASIDCNDFATLASLRRSKSFGPGQAAPWFLFLLNILGPLGPSLLLACACLASRNLTSNALKSLAHTHTCEGTVVTVVKGNDLIIPFLGINIFIPVSQIRELI